jgi:hypothetical protein
MFQTEQVANSYKLLQPYKCENIDSLYNSITNKWYPREDSNLRPTD